MAQAGLTVRGTSQAGGKPEHSDPTIRIRCGGSSTDKSYSRDNRLVPPKSSYRRRSSAPRCRLTLARWWRSYQAFGCSPIKKVRELGSNRSEINHDDWVLDSLNQLRKSRRTKVFRNCFNLRLSPSTQYVCHGGVVQKCTIWSSLISVKP